MDGDYGRIHRVAFKAVLSVLFAVAMLAVIGRIIMRFSYKRSLFADDYVLLFGCASLIGAFTLTNVMFEDVYFDMSLILGPPLLALQESQAPDFESHILKYQQLSFSTEVLCWVTIFAVKMSFLLFFRQMIDRLRAIMTYWTVTLGIVIVSGIFCVCSIFIACPHFGVSSVLCAQGSGFERTLGVSQAANALNMLTDLLIVAVPITLLWSVRIRLSQKIILGSFLCLSICMFAITLVRATKEIITGNTGKTVDVQWNVFWQMVEASIAVFVVSLTAFRSLYGMKTLQQQKKKRYEPWLASYRKNLLSRKKQRKVDEFGDTISDGHYSLPSIPGATMTGIRTVIGKMSPGSTQVMSRGGGLLSVDEVQEEEPRVIRVVNDFDMHQSIKSESNSFSSPR